MILPYGYHRLLVQVVSDEYGFCAKLSETFIKILFFVFSLLSGVFRDWVRSFLDKNFSLSMIIILLLSY